METPRIPAIHEDDWNEDQLEVLGAQKMRGNVQNIFPQPTCTGPTTAAVSGFDRV